MITLEKAATEGSTYVISCSILSETGEPVIPSSDVNWSLVDEYENELASGIVAPASSVSIVLTGESLTIRNPNRDSLNMRVIVETTYNSTNGNDLSFVEVITFKCNNVRR